MGGSQSRGSQCRVASVGLIVSQCRVATVGIATVDPQVAGVEGSGSLHATRSCIPTVVYKVR
jgi:hypothetical protein